MVMACIEIEARALKSNFLKQIRMNSTQQSFFDDLWSVDNLVNVSPDEFSVDDLLDLSDKDFTNSDYPSSDRFSDEKKNNSIVSSNFSSTGDLASLPENEIHLPVDEMESLEWLSQIVDDSILELSPSLPPATLKEPTGKLPVIPSFTVLGLSYPVPRKIRSKRSKKTGRVWSSLTESSMDDSSSYDSSTTMFSANPVQLFHCFMSFLKPATKKFKNNPVHKNYSSESTGCVTLRRCTHCHVHKTPQWRTGPEGPKTLCNACGVRFKSGRLFPEYRPACSPTFSGRLHSNSHRKVLEMRKMKENEDVKPGFRSGLGSLSC